MVSLLHTLLTLSSIHMAHRNSYEVCISGVNIECILPYHHIEATVVRKSNRIIMLTSGLLLGFCMHR